jgi:hypothetical protein
MKKTKEAYEAANKIIGQVEYMQGSTKVIVYEYANGARSHKKIRAPRPFYKHVWFYLVVILSFFVLLYFQPYWPEF